jgi:DNA-binding CsgD family transcriptional regulator/tetratricopeptide (TPR) repeat protein
VGVIATASGAAEELLERSEIIGELEEMLAQVAAGAPGRLLLIGGEAGVGKTVLVRRFCETRADAVRTLWGACEPLRTPRPLGPLVDVGVAVGGELGELVSRTARPHEVADALMRELRGGSPAVLVLEDLHWADEATLDVLTLLSWRIATVPALVLGTYRDDELDGAEQLRFTLGELVRRPARLKLAPLSPAGVRALAEPRGVDAHELYRRTGGNPFFVKEVLAATGEQIPETVRDAVLGRTARLSEGARRLLEAVAVVPGRVELWLLELLAGDLMAGIDECLTSGVLRAGRTDFAFRHELARLAFEEAIAPNRRLALHRAALAGLAARNADTARLAHHADAAGDAPGVLRWAPRAAEVAASAGAHREAAAQYERALRSAAGQPVDLRAVLLERLAHECYLTAEFDAAIVAQTEALDCRRQLGDLRGEGDARRVLSRLMFFAGRSAEGEPMVLEAVELLEGLPPGHELAMAYGNVSQRRMSVEDNDAAVAWGTRALDLARQLGDTEALVYALTNIGSAQTQSGDLDGRRKLEQALELALAHDLEEYAGRAFSSLAMWPLRHRRFALAVRPLEQGLAFCGQRGLDTWGLYLMALRARLELATGRWSDAAESAAVVLRDPRSAAVARGWALAALGTVRARRGDGEVSEPLQEALQLMSGTEELERIAPVAIAMAEAAWLAGDAAAVAGVTDAPLARALSVRAPWVAGELAFWRCQAGLRDELAHGAVAEPYRRAIAGEWARSAELWREIGCPYEAALCLAESDDQLAVRRSIDELRRLEARPASALVAQRLRERGVRGLPRGPRPQTRQNPAGLTARELEVLALLAEGLRNSQIAQRLTVSQRTVDHHVSAVLRKLDVSTRGQAGARALRLGLFDPN